MHHQSFSLFLTNTTPLNITNTTKHTVNSSSFNLLYAARARASRTRFWSRFILVSKYHAGPFRSCFFVEGEIESLTFLRDSSSCWSVRWTLTWSLGEYESAFIRFEILMAFQWRWRLRVLGVRLNQFRIGMTLGWIWWWLRNPDLGVDELGLWPKRRPFQWNIPLRFCHTLAH